MYPELYTFTWWNTSIPVMTFGLSITCSFGLFYWMLWRLGRKYGINTSFFSVHLFLFIVATFWVSRIAHILLYYGIPVKSAFSLDFPFSSFFLVSDFYFSLGGALLGFFLVFFFIFRSRDDLEKQHALDIVVISLLFAAILWYIWAFFWGQTYGILSERFGVDYTNSPHLAAFPRFPLAILYFLCTIFIFSLTYIIKKLRPEAGFAAGVWALLWGIMCFLGEWWNDASSDNISSLFGLLSHWKFLNFNQYISLICIFWWMWKVAHFVPSPISDMILVLWQDVWQIFRKSRQNIRSVIHRLRK